MAGRRMENLELRIENMELCLIPYAPLWLSAFVAMRQFEKTKPICQRTERRKHFTERILWQLIGLLR